MSLPRDLIEGDFAVTPNGHVVRIVDLDATETPPLAHVVYMSEIFESDATSRGWTRVTLTRPRAEHFDHVEAWLQARINDTEAVRTQLREQRAAMEIP